MTLTTIVDGITYTYTENASQTRCCLTKDPYESLLWWGSTSARFPAGIAPIEVLLYFSAARVAARMGVAS